MPTPSAERREREAVEIVVSQMRSACPAGLEVAVVGWPDDGPTNTVFPAWLTVDAVLRLTHGRHRVDWAAEVMTLTWHPKVKPAAAAVEAALQPVLDHLAREYDRTVVVSFRPPVGERDRGRAYIEAIVARVRSLLAGEAGADPFANDEYTYIDVSRSPPDGDAPLVQLWHSLTLTASVREQLAQTLVPPLTKKLEGQLRRAHQGGYSTMLILDAAGSPDLFAGPHFLASPDVLRQVVAETVIHHDHRTSSHCLDFCVLVRPDDTCTPLYGYWPQRPSP